MDTANYELSQYVGLGLIRAGNWDDAANNLAFRDYWSVQGIRERFVDGRDWEDTRYYQKARTQFEQRGEFWGYTDIGTFKRERCQYVDSLYEDMKRNGYRTNTEAGHIVPESGFKQKPHQHLEVLVTIDRHGNLLFRDGHHRVALAQLTNVERIPVQVLGRHRRWQQTRDTVAKATTPSALPDHLRTHLSHPDLQDVLPEPLRPDLAA